ncbi:hypothetical protein [Silvanigrella aquatica]|uniref:Uncharacterized protein n=1 Tax=Silvanigrella aquatica TaxID=1915309 RepID=A0A1L4CZE1_9BACT|nr:hypothetical protein [Silvanigrella aquatica]APJ03316.1 hypothetical protein AXG55_05120 [Silvanigrella aquatica]
MTEAELYVSGQFNESKKTTKFNIEFVDKLQNENQKITLICLENNLCKAYNILDTGSDYAFQNGEIKSIRQKRDLFHIPQSVFRELYRSTHRELNQIAAGTINTVNKVGTAIVRAITFNW